MSCPICDHLPTESRNPLPDAAGGLRERNPERVDIGGFADLWDCRACGRFYIFTLYIGVDSNLLGDGGDQTLEKLTLEQSEVIRAMLACTADPAAVEDALFALPKPAFNLTVAAALEKDRDFVALFIPRLLHAWAARTHDTGSLVMSLAEQPPSYAREVLAAATSLPAELRDKLGDLEARCRAAITSS